MRPGLPRNLLAILFAALILAACALNYDQDKKQVYIDANLLFSISYPETWAPFLMPTSLSDYLEHSVNWQVNETGSHNNVLTLTVLSLPQSGFITELDMLKEILTDIYVNMVSTASRTENLPAGLAFVLDGYTPQQTFRAWILNKSGRHYIIICASSPEQFLRIQPVFTEITQSFQVLEPRHHDQAD